ncbi:MAG: thiamine pyrophosphate-dependent dehydrogenase E1 component subunit alpha [Trueperaceae bacterium]|nr:MAG: thiamine pyrophosphate-dependent dehydrogenase E1 component subunit alpha [Trueperaceae bacterium]
MTRLERFRAMLTLRHFDEACLEGVPTGEIHGELHTGIGQEAIGAGMMESLQPGDAVVSTHRNHYHALAAGVPMKPMLAEIFEKASGLCRGRGGHMHLFDAEHNFSCSGIVGASLPVALGYAYSFSMKGQNNLAVGVTGDGGANNGAFHECLNIAGAWKLPLVVLVENNELAISVPIGDVSATATIAERACAYGAWGKKVDGTDVDIVAEAFAEAAHHARSGRGPAILEASCHRFRGHFEGDHDSYRTMKEKREMRERHDPITIARRKLLAEGLAGEAELDAMAEASQREMAELLAEVRAEPLPEAAGALDYLFVGGKR